MPCRGCNQIAAHKANDPTLGTGLSRTGAETSREKRAGLLGLYYCLLSYNMLQLERLIHSLIILKLQIMFQALTSTMPRGFSRRPREYTSQSTTSTWMGRKSITIISMLPRACSAELAWTKMDGRTSQATISNPDSAALGIASTSPKTIPESLTRTTRARTMLTI